MSDRVKLVFEPAGEGTFKLVDVEDAGGHLTGNDQTGEDTEGHLGTASWAMWWTSSSGHYVNRIALDAVDGPEEPRYRIRVERDDVTGHRAGEAGDDVAGHISPSGPTTAL